MLKTFQITKWGIGVVDRKFLAANALLCVFALMAFGQFLLIDKNDFQNPTDELSIALESVSAAIKRFRWSQHRPPIFLRTENEADATYERIGRLLSFDFVRSDLDGLNGAQGAGRSNPMNRARTRPSIAGDVDISYQHAPIYRHGTTVQNLFRNRPRKTH